MSNNMRKILSLTKRQFLISNLKLKSRYCCIILKFCIIGIEVKLDAKNL